MHLIFIRHGDPDYKHDSLTEKGFKEAELLSKRVSAWNINQIYLSPYGRAQKTAMPFLSKMNRQAVTLPWLKEFDSKIIDPDTKLPRGCWDWLPESFYGEKRYLDRKKWYKTKPMKDAEIQARYLEVCNGIDAILESNGFKRRDFWTPIYSCSPHISPEEASVDTHLLSGQKDLDSRNLVFVCHLGVMFCMMAHLTGIAPTQLWQGFFVAPTSVTVLSMEERIPGKAVFRVQTLGDASHLIQNGENSSDSGFFGHTIDL
ncbi:MAG: histidine phosphatase family protein [Treponema sp.]|nr:histidine phosphatase family protein [Treponema sp.]